MLSDGALMVRGFRFRVGDFLARGTGLAEVAAFVWFCLEDANFFLGGVVPDSRRDPGLDEF